MKIKEIFKEDILTKNPTYVLLLGMCPSLAITTSIDNAIGMMIAVTLVLMLTNLVVSLIRKLIPEEIRLPVYIIIIATFVTCISLLLEAYAYSLYEALGIFLPLITVNCIVLGRAEAFASRNSVGHSVIDGLASGLGFGLGIFSIAFVRELFGTGNIVLHNAFNNGEEFFNLAKLLGIEEFTTSHAITLFTSGAGAFLVFGLLVAIVTSISLHKQNKKVNTEVSQTKEVKENA
jgi:electron transport complex protein RnfE